ERAQSDLCHLLILVAEIAHLVLIVAPAFLDLDPQFKKHLGIQHTLDIRARLPPNLFEHSTLFADDDTLVTTLFTVNNSVNFDQTVLTLMPPLNADCNTVRHFAV